MTDSATISQAAEMSLDDAVRAVQAAVNSPSAHRALATATELVLKRLKIISHSRDFLGVTEADREDLIQETFLRVMQARNPLQGRNEGAAHIYLHRIFRNLRLDQVSQNKPPDQKPAKGDTAPEITAMPKRHAMPAADTALESGDGEDERPVSVRTEHFGPEDTLSADQGLSWAWRELTEHIRPELPGDSPRGLDELCRMELQKATMDDLLVEEGIHANSSRSDFEEARDRIYQRRSRAIRRTVKRIADYEDEGERYFLLLVMKKLRGVG